MFRTIMIVSCFVAGSATAQQLSLEQAPIQMERSLTCTFVAECYESEACSETAYSLALNARMGGLTADELVVEAIMSDDAGDTSFLGLGDSRGMLLSSVGDADAMRLFTLAADGNSRLTQHFKAGPMAITYLGTCE